MNQQSNSWTQDLLVYAHIGDLHVTDRSQENFRDLLAIVAEIETVGSSLFDFVYLPGDNADNGTDEQYKLVATALRMLSIPVYAITGDHDMESGSLAPFYRTLGSRTLPHTQKAGGVDCVFLDMSGEGKGGPDFRLPSGQTRHLEAAVESAKSAGRVLAVFMHTYPADLVDVTERDAVNRLLADPTVRLVDMGHTHYNEVANDGRTIFAATRSTGQIEEGPVGYSIVALDDGQVSWRFKPLDDDALFVMITTPADRRLRTGSIIRTRPFEIHAITMGASGASRCEWRADDDDWQAMRPTQDGRGFAAADTPLAIDVSRLEVRVTDADGRCAHDAIEISGGTERSFSQDGSDRDVIEAWPERHLLGTQLGPNRNGKKW